MDYKIRFKPVLSGPVTHGGPGSEAESAGCGGYGSYTDFSVCVNPFPLPEAVRAAIEAAAAGKGLSAYPERTAESFCLRAAGVHGIEPARVSAFNGVSQAIFVLSLLFLDRSSRVIVSAPAYSEYEACSRMAGAEVERIWPEDRRDFAPGIERICRRVSETRPEILWICNPNNPTGVLIGPGDMSGIYQACLSAGTLLVIDEAYMNFVPEPRRFSFKGADCVILRSMTKDFSLPGLRLGYITAPPEIAAAADKIKPPWSVNSAAAAAGISAFDSMDEYGRQWVRLRQEKSRLERGLGDLGFRTVPSDSNFILFECPGGETGSAKIRTRLLADKILIRDCTSFGLPGYLRAGVLGEENNRRLLEVLKESVK